MDEVYIIEIKDYVPGSGTLCAIYGKRENAEKALRLSAKPENLVIRPYKLDDYLMES